MVYYTVSVLVVGCKSLIYQKIAHFYVRVCFKMGVENRDTTSPAKKNVHLYAMYMTLICYYEPISGLRMHGKDVS